MPIYEFECINETCKRVTSKFFDIVLSHDDMPFLLCPRCFHQAKRIISQCNFRFGDKHEYNQY